MRIAREKAGLTIQQLANGMNLSQKQIMALESDDLTALPSATFVRGFVRNYARIVGCDPAQFEMVNPVQPVQSTPLSITLSPPAENMPIQSNRADANRRWMIAAGVIVVIGLIGGYVKREHVEQARSLIVQQADVPSPATAPKLAPEDQPAAAAASPAPVTSGGNTETTAALVAPPVASAPAVPPPAATVPAAKLPSSTTNAPTPATIAANSAGNTSSATVPPAKVSSVSPVTASSAPTVPPVTTSNTKPTPLDADAANPTPAAPPRLDPNLPAYPVVLDLSQESWVDVREIGGKVFVHGIVKPGERREFQARGQVKVTIGNAPGVKLSWKGKVIDLTDSTKDSVARMTLDPEAE